jgi:hypothetical protein
MIELNDFVERAFNQTLIELIETLDDLEETDKDSREDWFQNEMYMFLDRLAKVYAIQAQMESDRDTAHALVHTAEKFMELSDQLSDTNKAEFSIFMSLYNPETSTDVFGSIKAAKIFYAEENKAQR